MDVDAGDAREGEHDRLRADEAIDLRRPGLGAVVGVGEGVEEGRVELVGARAAVGIGFVRHLPAVGQHAGRQAGELIKKAIPDGGKIMIFVGKRDAQNAKERIQGLEEVLKGTNVSVIDVRTDDTDRVRARQNVADTLVKYPDIACLVGIWSYNGPAIVNSVKTAGKSGKVKVVTFDEEDDTLQGIKDGVVESTVVQNPYEFGHQSTLLLAKKLRGEDVQIPENKQVIVPTRAIDKSNVDEFWANLKKLRGH